MVALWKRILGVSLILVGVVGLFLPLLQGILLIIAGFVLLEVDKIKDLIHKFLPKKFLKYTFHN